MTNPSPGGELDALIGKMKSAASPMRTLLRELKDKYQPLRAANGRYIRSWRRPTPIRLPLAWSRPMDGFFPLVIRDQLFTIQSISKPFVFGLALEMHGREHVLTKVGVEPTGEAFNAIVLDEVSNRPFKTRWSTRRHCPPT